MTTLAELALPDGYETLLGELKERVREARTKAALAVNAELIALYWQIRKAILDQQAAEGWGTRVVERLATDLRKEFPEMTGLGRANLL